MQVILTEGTQAPPGALLQPFLVILVIFMIFYFLLIRPERKKQKLRQQRYEQMVANLKKNDRVITKGGIHGVLKAVRPDDVLLVIDESNNTRLKLDRRSIARVITKEEGELSDKEA